MKKDRIITIQSASFADSDYSDGDTPTWSNYLANVPASLSFLGRSGTDESIENSQRVASETAIWRIIFPNNKTITDEMRVVYDSKNYKINRIREIGLRQELELTTERRDNG